MVERDLAAQLAARIRGLRAQRGWTLEALASRSQVSRSAISLIERAESSPTAAVLDRIAAALDVTLSSLLAAEGAVDGDGAGSDLQRAASQAVWTDPASGYQRRSLSPRTDGRGLQLVEIHFPAGARVVYDNALHPPGLAQQVWMLEGEMEVTAGDATHRLAPGDCLATRLDAPTGVHNPGVDPARYLVAVAMLAAPEAAPIPAGARARRRPSEVEAA